MLAALATRARLPTYSWYVPMWRATIALMEGRLGEGIQLARRAREMGDRVGDNNAERCHIHHRFTRLVLDERHDEMFSEFYAGDLAYATRKLNSPAGPTYGLTLTWLLAATGRLDQAREQFEPLAVNCFSAVPRDVNWLAGMSSATDGCLLLGDMRYAAEVRALIEPFSDGMTVSARGCAFRGSMSRDVARLAATLGDHDNADELFAESARRDERVGAPVWLAHDFWHHGQLRLALGDETEAARLLGQALEIHNQLGSST
jgi:tetratricopeptide (TPR) repeat protein